MDEMVETVKTQPADLAERSRTAGGDKSAGGPPPRRFSAKRKLQAVNRLMRGEPVNRHRNGTPDRRAKGTPLSMFLACPGSEQEGPRVTRSAFRDDGAARAGGGLFAHRGKCGDDQPRFLNRQDSLPVSMISQ